MACMLAAILGAAACPAQSVSATGTGAAEIPAVSYYGRAGQFVFTPGTAENPADLFQMFKGMVPGDEREQEITLRSAAASGAPINLFLRAYVPAPGADATEKEKEDAAKAEALLKKMTIQISCDEFSDRPMLEAGAYPDQGMGSWVFLGRFAYNTTSILRVKVQMPAVLADGPDASGNNSGYADNDFQGMEAKVRWAFLVEEFDDTAPGGGGGEDPTPNPTPETLTPGPTPLVAVVTAPGGGGEAEEEAPEELEDLPTPLAPPADEELGLPEEEVPLAGMAQGDAGWALLNFALMNLTIYESVMLLIGYFVRTKNEEEGEKRKLKKKGLFRVISLPIAAVSLIVFILTEDITLPTVLVDKYTVVMLIIAIVQTVMVALSRKKYEDREETEV